MSASCTPNSWRWARAWNSCSRYGFDSAGKGLASNRFFPVPRIDASDREYFRWHQANRPGVYISEPLISRTTGEAFFDVSRRWDHDGKFAGVVTVSLYPTYFTEFYRGMASIARG